MATKTLSPYKATIGSVSVSLVADPDKPDQDGTAYTGSYEAQEANNRFVHRDVPKILSSFRRGAGKTQITSPDDEDGYIWAESLYMHFGSGPVLAGAVNNYDLTGGVAFTNDNGKGALPLNNGRIVQMIEAFGDLYLIYDKSAIVRIPTCNPASAPDYDPAISTGYATGTATTAFGANLSGRCAELFQTTGKAGSLVVGFRNTSTGFGRVYEATAAHTWTGGVAADMTYTADKMAVTYWSSKSDGAGANRLLIRSAPGEIRHCIENSDPTASASYVTPIKVGTASDDVLALVAAPQHAYAVTARGIVDFDEYRVRQLTPYWRTTRSLTTQAASVNYGLPALLYDDNIYASRGFGSIDRYPITQDGYQQRIVGECGFGAYAQDGSPLGNLWITAMCESGDGWLLCAGFNPDNGYTYIGRAMDRQRAGVPGPGPLVWHWSEVVIPPVVGVKYMATAMQVSAPALSVGAILGSPKTYLWIALYPASGGQAVLKYVEMPVGGGPLALRASGGTAINHALTGTLYCTGQTYDDATSLKAARRVDLTHQSVSANQTIAVALRADGDPSTIAAGTGFTTEGTADGSHPDATSTNIVPATVTTGKVIYPRLTFTVNAASTQSPRLQELRLRCNVRYEVFEVVYLNVVLERDYETSSGTRELRSVDTVLSTLAGYQLTAPVTYVNDRGSYQALVEQGITYSRAHVEGMGWRTIAQLQLSIVKAN